MTIETEPFFASFEPHPELIQQYRGDLLARIFLPYSHLHWLNFERYPAGRQMKDYYSKHGKFPQEFYGDEDWETKNDKGDLIPGNITAEIYWAVHFSVPLERLAHIKQLSLLAFSTENEINFYPMASEFNQTRLNHVYLVAKTLELILRQNDFNEEEINLGIISALVHDLATPPFGDPTKETDPEALSEETALERILNKFELKWLEQYGYDKNKVLAIVRNEGLLGNLLDIADKIAYTSVDVYHYAGDILYPPDQGLLNPTLEPIRRILRADPKWANIYQEVSLSKEDGPYFKDHKRLGRFLELRARMHKALYLNPHCRGRDYMYKMLFLPCYSREPDPKFPINADNLINLTDEELGRILNRHWQIMHDGYPFQFVLGVLPDYKQVKNSAEISQVVKELKEQNLTPLGTETIRKFDPAIHFLTVDPKDNQIKPYRKVNPTHAAHLQKIVEVCNRTVVYFWPSDSLVDETWADLKQVIVTLVEKAREQNGGNLPHFSLY